MDDADKKILRTIQANPTMTMREIGEKTGLSHTPCWRRLQKMRREGIIAEKRYILNPAALGYDIIAFCFIRMKEQTRKCLIEFEEGAEKLPEVLQCYSLSGEYDYVLRVLAKSVKEYEGVVKNSLLELPHVGSINTSFSLKEIKNSVDIPI